MLDITTLAAWGEFIGGIAVVVSLIYLASQIRQNSKLLRASTASATAQTQTTAAVLQAQDPDVARIFWDGIQDRASLSESDRRRFDMLAEVTMMGTLQQYEFTREGIQLPLAAERREAGLRRMSQGPGFKEWWREGMGTDYPQEFRDYVDGLIREGEAAE
jgi:hypothetical protein